jgi:hypothetical protein
VGDEIPWGAARLSGTDAPPAVRRPWMIEGLFVVTVLELFLGGGGRLLEIGPGTARMVLFAVCAPIGLFALLAVRRVSGGQLLAVNLVLAYLAVHFAGLITGSLHGADAADMLAELQQSMFWLAAPFFALVLQSPRMVVRAAALVRFSGVLLAIAYLVILSGTFLGVINGMAIFGKLNASGEFVGRGEGLFVYKGFLYLCIAVIFLVAIRGRYWRILTLLVCTAIAMTLTRGFMLATALGVLLMLFQQGRARALIIGLLLAIVAVYVLYEYLPTFMPGGPTARFTTSDNQRLDDSAYIGEHMSWRTIVTGEGLGIPINSRGNIENTYLWVFWKFGLMGIAFWLVPLVLCTWYFGKVPHKGRDQLAVAWYFGVFVVYIQTATNPYLTNPIGLSYVLVALFSLRTLAAQARAPSSLPTASDGPAPVGQPAR